MIQRSHGVYLPPRKNKNRSGYITVRFVLTGMVPAKKNRQIATINRLHILSRGAAFARHGEFSVKVLKRILEEKSSKPYIRRSKKFEEWNTAAKAIIATQAAKHIKSYEKYNLSFPIKEASISIYHYWKDNYIRDSSNRLDTVQDLLVEAGILLDDSWHNLSPVKVDADIYAGEILDHITVVDLTAYRW
jgi:hypothetical protein